ncbi:MAG: SpoIID/LytB domain-containing protein [Oligoflexia bacterium]|nr:SpoIID/LytB domain-containing protein [Oligoflexia bacterium]
MLFSFINTDGFALGRPSEEVSSSDNIKNERSALKVQLAGDLNSVKLGGIGIYIVSGGRKFSINNAAREFEVLPYKKGFMIRGHGYRKLFKTASIDVVSLAGSLRIRMVPFSGYLRIYRSGKSLGLINVTDFENYLAAVLSREYEGRAGNEMLKALAVVVRTGLLKQLAEKKENNDPYDIKDDLPAYIGEGEYGRMLKIVRETRNQVLYEGKDLYHAMYHSSCGGSTDKVKCPYCEAAPGFVWRFDITPDELERKLLLDGYKIRGLKAVYINTKTDNGRISRLHITAANGSFYIDTGRLQSLIGTDRIRSSAFSVSGNEKLITIIGKGSGHGMGLCKWGSIMMDRRGFKYSDILNKYFPGMDLRYYSNENI